MANAIKNNALGGGVFLALGVIGGLLAGGQFDEPIIGLLAGLAIGAALAALVWLMRR
ncbi:MAG: hypothetical protein HKN78_04140 [Sphingomonadaceae bacterium]|nr:hypothetical protein [Sphingomonadaceae bacterium]